MIPSVIAGAEYPGVYSRRIGLQGLIDEAAGRNDVPMVLHEKGEPIEGIHLGDDPVFVVGDQVGLAKKDEEFVMRRGRRVSLGRRSYLAAACVAVINHSLDRRESQRRAGG
jgi:tRNA pseudouridine-54 N-methylase